MSDPVRLAALAGTGLGATPDPTFDIAARLVRTLLDVPVALVTLVDAVRQFFPGLAGLTGPAAANRHTPLSESYCKYVVGSGEALVIDDVAAEPRYRDHPAHTMWGVGAYAGMPLVDADGNVLGSLCAIDIEARVWTDSELGLLADLAAFCSSELQLRLARRRAEQALDGVALLAEVTRALASTDDVEVALRRLAMVLVPRLADWCVIDRAEPPDQVRRVAIEHSDPSLDLTGLLHALPRLRPESTGSLARAVRGESRQVLVSHANAVGIEPGCTDALLTVPADPLDAAQDELFALLGARHAIVESLRVPGTVLGAVTLVRTSDRPFLLAERELLDELAARAAVSLARTRLFAQQRETSQALQASMLTQLPDPSRLSVAARYLPAGAGLEVGGDWYDAFEVPGGGTAVAIGDVMGHDIGAAATMGQLRSMLRALFYDAYGQVPQSRGEGGGESGGEGGGTAGEASPAKVLGRLDRVIAGLQLGGLATCVVGVVEPDPDRPGWRLRWSGAGHPPPMVRRADGRVDVLTDATGVMLGVAPQFDRVDVVTPLQVGDVVVLVTDGLLEGPEMSVDEGIDRLAGALRILAARDAEQICTDLVRGLVGDEPGDDTAVLAVQVRALPAGPDARTPNASTPPRGRHLDQARARMRP